MSDEEKRDQAGNRDFTAPLAPYIPEGMTAQFASSFGLVHTKDEIYLSFFQPEVPYIDEQSPEKKLPPIKNRCVARIVLTPAGLKALTGMLHSFVYPNSGITDKVGSD